MEFAPIPLIPPRESGKTEKDNSFHGYGGGLTKRKHPALHPSFQVSRIGRDQTWEFHCHESWGCQPLASRRAVIVRLPQPPKPERLMLPVNHSRLQTERWPPGVLSLHTLHGGPERERTFPEAQSKQAAGPGLQCQPLSSGLHTHSLNKH